MSKHEQPEQPQVEGGESSGKLERRKLGDEMQDVGAQRLEAIRSGFRSFRDGFAARFHGLKGGIEKAVRFVIAPDVAVKRGAEVTRDAAVDAGRATRDFTVGQVEAGKQKVEAARDWTVATGTAARNKAVETGRAVGHGAKVGAEVAAGAAIYGVEQGVKSVKRAGEAVGHAGAEVGRAARHRAEIAVQKGHEAVGAGKEWVVDRAADIHDRAVLARDRFTGRVETIRTGFKAKLEAYRAQRQETREWREYLALADQKDALQAKLARLSELEKRFSPSAAE